MECYNQIHSGCTLVLKDDMGWIAYGQVCRHKPVGVSTFFASLPSGDTTDPRRKDERPAERLMAGVNPSAELLQAR